MWYTFVSPSTKGGDRQYLQNTSAMLKHG